MEYRCIGLDIWRVPVSPPRCRGKVTQLCSSFFGQGDESPRPPIAPKNRLFQQTVLPDTGIGSLYSIDFWFLGVLYLGQ